MKIHFLLKVLEEAIRAAEQSAAAHVNNHSRLAAAQKGAEDEGRVEQVVHLIGARSQKQGEHRHNESCQVRSFTSKKTRFSKKYLQIILPSCPSPPAVSLFRTHYLCTDS